MKAAAVYRRLELTMQEAGVAMLACRWCARTTSYSCAVRGVGMAGTAVLADGEPKSTQLSAMTMPSMRRDPCKHIMPLPRTASIANLPKVPFKRCQNTRQTSESSGRSSSSSLAPPAPPKPPPAHVAPPRDAATRTVVRWSRSHRRQVRLSQRPRGAWTAETTRSRAASFKATSRTTLVEGLLHQLQEKVPHTKP
eukprot:6183549-Pleurochrysis_carterae.AAC.2